MSSLKNIINIGSLSQLSFKEIVDKISDGENFQDIFGISDEMMQEFYKISMDYFNNKQFQEASDCFLFLTSLNPFESNLWIKSGNAEYALGHFSEALSAYSLAMLWDANDPFPHFYSAEAYHMLNDHHLAKECLNICLRLIEEHLEYKPLLEPAHKLLESITRR